MDIRLCVLILRHCRREDTKPQSTDSYFKKYTWQPIYCGCGRQVGWKFVHIDEEPVKNYKSKTTTWSSGVKVIEYHAAEEENKLKSLEGNAHMTVSFDFIREMHQFFPIQVNV